jgi:regulator of sirC expression with transglutaminase-like and TPR domain
VYIEIGRRIGLSLQGVSFPTHFLVKCVLREGAIILDPYARGASLGVDDLQERLRSVSEGLELDAHLVTSLLTPAAPADIFARMLRNLRAIHLERGEHLKALCASNRILALQPAAADEYRERGELYDKLECFRAALADFRQYLKLHPQARDSERIASRMAELEPIASRLN